MFNLKVYLLRAVAFLFALSASVSLSMNLYNLMSASQLPSGLGAALYYDALANGRTDSLTPTERLLYPFIPFTMHVFNLDLLTALKLIPTLLLSVLPLLVYLLSSTVTGSRLVGAAAAWILAFMPVTISFIVGDYGLILVLLFFTAYICFLVKYLKRKKRLALCLTLLASGLILLTMGSSLGTQGQVFRVPDIWAENTCFSLSIVVGVAVGIYTLLKRARTVALSVLLASAIVPFALALIPALNSLQILSTPILALLVASPLLWFRESCLVHEMNALGHSPVVEVVIDLPKLAALLLVAFLTVSTVIVGYNVSASIYNEYSVSRDFTDEEIASAVRWMKENIRGEAVLSSKPMVAAWLEALSGKRFIGFGELNEALISETVESTSFRILTPSLLVDEWEPSSTSRAPLISYYDGGRYEPIAYIDDSFVRARLIKGGEEWVESPYRAAYRGYQWLSNTQLEAILVQRFETYGLLFEKTIRVSTSEPHLKVGYQVDPKTGVELIGLELPVWVGWLREARILETTNDETTLAVDGREIKISFSGNIESLMREECDEGHAMVKAEFAPVGDAIKAEVVALIRSKERSEMPLWLGNTPELIENYNIEYVVAEADRIGWLVDPVESLIIKDSFNRIIFDASDKTVVEAPSSCLVRFDESSTDGARLIGYQTNYLHINKTLTKSERSIEVRYDVAPIKSSSSLVGMNLTIWIPWGVLLLDQTIDGSMVKLKLGYGELKIIFIGDPIHVEVGPDPEYGQNMVRAVLRLKKEGDEVGVNVSSSKPLLPEYEATTRPVMESEDRLSVYMDTNLFTVVFKEGALVVCRTNP